MTAAARNPLLLPPASADNAVMQTEPPQADPPKRKRRWFQFSLRTLMAVVLLVAFCMAIWIVPIKNRAERQKAVVAAIIKSGGSVIYDYQLNQHANPPTSVKPEPTAPAWLRGLLGDDFFTNVVVASVRTDADLKELHGLNHLLGINHWVIGSRGERRRSSGDGITDAGLEHLADLSELLDLDLSYTGITDAGLECIKRLKHLQTLDLSGTRITDQGLTAIRGLTGLKKLVLGDTNVTDAGIEQLQGLSGLEELCVWNTAVTDSGLNYVKGMNELQFLNLRGTKVTDAGVERLIGLSKLQTLALCETSVTDASASRLAALKNLQQLSLKKTLVTDAGLEGVKSLTQLKELSVEGSQVTNAGVNELQKALPNCRIAH
jgi:internalin A